MVREDNCRIYPIVETDFSIASTGVQKILLEELHLNGYSVKQTRKNLRRRESAKKHYNYLKIEFGELFLKLQKKTKCISEHKEKTTKNARSKGRTIFSEYRTHKNYFTVGIVDTNV